MKKLVIFDLDGTLLNTITDLGMAANYTLEKNGYPTHPLASYPFFVGNGVKKLLERVLPEDSCSPKKFDQILRDFKDYYDLHCTDATIPYDGIIELLTSLKNEGVEVAVASNKYQEAVERIIKHYFGDFKFIAIEGQKPDIPVKPDPSIVFSILGLSEIPKCQTLYIGDSGVDMETAWRACVDSVGVKWGFRPEKELRNNHATFIVDSPMQIMDIVKDKNVIAYLNK